MKILDLKPNTPEWLEFRRTKIGASDAPIIMHDSPYKSPLDLWRDKMDMRSTFRSSAMQEGHDLEPQLRGHVNNVHSAMFRECVVQSDKYPWMIASLDGYDPVGDRILEIKTTRNKEKIDMLMNGDVPKDWMWQIQHQIYVTGLPRCLLFAYCFDEKIYVTVHRDEAMIDALIAKEEEFYQNLISFTPPAGKLPEKEGAAFADVIILYNEAVEGEKMMKALKEKYKGMMVEMGGGVPYTAYGRNVNWVVKPGPVNYKSIPQLEGVNLDAYRGKPIEYWEIR